MTDNTDLNRREFIKGVTLTSLGMAFAIEEIDAEAQGAAKPAEQAGSPVKCAVIGLGLQGREILASLAKIPKAPVVSLCDTYANASFLKRSTDVAPKAKVFQDYKQILSDPEVQAVFVATPSHLHKQIALAALAAGKHVYCEAPLATTIEDAKAIATAGAAAKTVFTPGMQFRSNKMHNHIVKFTKSRAWGKLAQARAQWHKKTSWKIAATTPERELEMNWRISKATSLGLPGEVGIHSIDLTNWYFNALPISVTAFGGIYNWKDGRDVPDTVQFILEYPNSVRLVYDATLVSSFDNSYDVFMGSDSSIFVRDQRGWMFKESDAPMLGWEVYAQKDKMGVGTDVNGTGIALVADATKLMSLGQEPGKVGTDVTKTALFYAVSNFVATAGGVKGLPIATAQDAYAATVIAAKVVESIGAGSKVAISKDQLTI